MHLPLENSLASFERTPEHMDGLSLWAVGDEDIQKVREMLASEYSPENLTSHLTMHTVSLSLSLVQAPRCPSCSNCLATYQNKRYF